jgi:hypothetical protein
MVYDITVCFSFSLALILSMGGSGLLLFPIPYSQQISFLSFAPSPKEISSVARTIWKNLLRERKKCPGNDNNILAYTF